MRKHGFKEVKCIVIDEETSIEFGSKNQKRKKELEIIIVTTKLNHSLHLYMEILCPVF